jgi:hypothetical protein
LPDRANGDGSDSLHLVGYATRQTWILAKDDPTSAFAPRHDFGGLTGQTACESFAFLRGLSCGSPLMSYFLKIRSIAFECLNDIAHHRIGAFH